MPRQMSTTWQGRPSRKLNWYNSRNRTMRKSKALLMLRKTMRSSTSSYATKLSLTKMPLHSISASNWWHLVLNTTSTLSLKLFKSLAQKSCWTQSYNSTKSACSTLFRSYKKSHERNAGPSMSRLSKSTSQLIRTKLSSGKFPTNQSGRFSWMQSLRSSSRSLLCIA